MALHQRTHPGLDVPGCFGCKAAGVSISADAMPFRKAATAVANITDRRMVKDHEAYRRLRKDGLQPPRIASDGRLPGPAEIEKHARTKDEVEAGRPLPGDGRLRPELLPQ